MEFSIRFTEEGRETLHKLHIENQKRIKAGLKELSKNLKLGKELTGRLTGFSSIHIGKDRAIYSIEGNTIFVHYVGNRKDVYNKFKG